MFSVKQQFIQLKDVNTFIKPGTKLHAFISPQSKMLDVALSYKGWWFLLAAAKPWGAFCCRVKGDLIMKLSHSKPWISAASFPLLCPSPSTPTVPLHSQHGGAVSLGQGHVTHPFWPQTTVVVRGSAVQVLPVGWCMGCLVTPRFGSRIGFVGN